MRVSFIFLTAILTVLIVFISCILPTTPKTPKEKALKLAEEWGQTKAEAEQDRQYKRLSRSWVGSAKKQKIAAVYKAFEIDDAKASFAVRASIRCGVNLVAMGQTVEYSGCGRYYLIINTTSESIREVEEEEYNNLSKSP